MSVNLIGQATLAIDPLDANTNMPIRAPVVHLEREDTIAAEGALAACRPTATTSRTLHVQGFLSEILTGRPAPQQTIIERGATHGFSYDQLKLAKRALDARTLDQGTPTTTRHAEPKG
jgi:hypothetical protein